MNNPKSGIATTMFAWLPNTAPLKAQYLSQDSRQEKSCLQGELFLILYWNYWHQFIQMFYNYYDCNDCDFDYDHDDYERIIGRFLMSYPESTELFLKNAKTMLQVVVDLL